MTYSCLQEVPEPPTGVVVNELSPRRAVITIEGSKEHVQYYNITYQATRNEEQERVRN